ncbi:hypothetical protein [Pseudooceanicola sp. LIPI14-2-Ac024]|uniref:hypothetical protein n=1 Tax=Pseudooceanicola sp. LIPI14-2-Ac024 TaxID=3344875 RepID=UPI0035CF40A5
MRSALTALSIIVASASAAQAECRIQVGQARCVVPDSAAGQAAAQSGDATGARFVEAGPASQPTAPGFAPGDILPDEYTILFNRARHGLPPPENGWTYFDVDGEIYRADLFTRTVVGRVD